MQAAAQQQPSNRVARPVTPPPIAQPAAPAKRASRVGMAKGGQISSATRWLIYGPEGVGKSSLAADAPSVIYLDVENSSMWISVDRYQYHDGPHGHVPRSYRDVIDAIEDLATSTHEYKTVVIDTVDALEAKMHQWLCAVHKEKSIEDFGYGKGYAKAVEEWRFFLSKCDTLVSRGINVILLGHSHVKAFKNPVGEDYDRYQLRMNEKAGSVLKEWCDSVGFLRHDEFAAKLKGDKSFNQRSRGYSTKSRVLNFDRDAAWDAKTRLPLPAQIVVEAQHPWRPLQEAISQGNALTDDQLRAQVEAELERIGELIITANGRQVDPATIRADIANGDRSLLTRTVGFLRAIEPYQPPAESDEQNEGNQ